MSGEVRSGPLFWWPLKRWETGTKKCVPFNVQYLFALFVILANVVET